MSPQEVERLFAQLAPAVFRRARRLLARDADAWDVVQEVFERMLSHGATFRGEARPMTWMYRVTTNVALNVLRSRRCQEPVKAPAMDDVSDGIEDVEARQLLAKWMARLSERELAIATLLYLDGLTQQEVADILQLSRKTIGREVDALRAKLEALGAQPQGVK